MGSILRLIGLCVILVGLAGATAAVEDFSDWRAGDLVFFESRTPQAHAIRVATGSRYTHMGIVDSDGEGFSVLEAGAVVTETPLADFIARGVGGDYAVYRIADLAEKDAAKALEAARTYLGLPYDHFFRLDADAIYCSELPYYAFGVVGTDLGDVERLGDLDIDTPEGREIFLSRWQDHPDCLAEGLDREGCWALVQRQEIITPISIARDPGVALVFSTFDDQ
ncbi:YiiX/YebB-like N1pC/P60 family cysteine hydrolase [Pelagibacterium lacus]|uniref:Peptidoglycan peptidase n=1 Tax=Pelagibacterium lacus TaxID=2282655 RepID=A0A369W0X4_9HYPH|nr:YiiX/YebB-like N1pC/P60 family cysteine hydrolase [Pelagibacterium lacus]RDE08324.1 peptidoglycan peptidase [Pelagibacterium lacus]